MAIPKPVAGSSRFKRLNPHNTQEVRARIQTVHLLKRLQDHAHNQLEMTPSQIDAAKFLISYSLSKPAQDVQVQHDGELVIRWKS